MSELTRKLSVGALSAGTGISAFASLENLVSLAAMKAEAFGSGLALTAVETGDRLTPEHYQKAVVAVENVARGDIYTGLFFAALTGVLAAYTMSLAKKNAY